jgi:hypothetical protein
MHTLRMKKLTLFLASIILVVVVVHAKPKFPPIKKNGAKINLLSPIYSNLSVSYQCLLTPFRSLQLTASYMDFNDFRYYGNIDDLRVTGFSITPEYRINFSGYGLNGFYVGPFLRYMDYKKTFDYDNYSTSVKENSSFKSAGIGFNVGKQFIIKNKVLVDLFAGPVYQVLVQEKINQSIIRQTPMFYDYEDYSDYLAPSIPNRYIKGYGIRAGITIGIAF